MPCPHPGKILQHQYMAPNRLSQNALARAIKVPPRRINEIIHEKRGITADTAVRLATYFGGSAGYWMHLQAEYEIEQVQHQVNVQLASIQSAMHPPTTIEPEPAINPESTSIDKANTQKPQHKISRRLLR